MTEDIILQYISGSLTGEALDIFEEQLEKDQSLQNDVKLYQAMARYAGTKNKIKDSVEVIKDVGKEFKPANVIDLKPKTNNVRRFLIATAIAAIFLIGMFIRPMLQSSSSDSMLIDQSFYAVSPLSFSSRSAEANIIYENAAKAFNNEDYESAINYLSTVIAGEPGNLKAQFYKGVSLMRLGNFNSARNAFEPLVEHPLYIHASRYHTGLSFYEEENFDVARSAFEAIPESSNYYKKARVILQTIGVK